MNKNKLFDDSEESDQDVKLKTNVDYAKSYNKFRQKELLKKYKDRGIDVSESESSSESESTDEDEIVDSKFDKEFFKTLASLKSKNPAIYDKNTRFFDGLEEDENKEKKVSSKPVTLKDYERKIILEKGGKFEDDSESDSENREVRSRTPSPTYVEEQRKLKEEFQKVVNAEDSEEEEFGGIFKKRVKSKEEKDKEEADFTKWLAGKKDDVEDEVKESLAPLKSYWTKSNLPQSEKFLRDYILNQGYAETAFADIPTYDEIVGEKDLSEDEQELEKQAEFEHKYNFRFEEPDSEFIKRYPRTIEQSVRKKDDKRKQKREELKERKDRERQQKMQELELIREMKRREIEEKIKKLKEVTGNDELGFKDEELEDDFDPDAHDRRMQELFNDDYYQVDEGEEKPECPDIDDLKIEDWDAYDPGKEDEGYEPHCEDENFNMDCDYDPNSKENMQKELIENTRDKRKKRKRNRFLEVIKAEKPVFNPEDGKTYEEYMDEYYQLDCEDIIGDLPCRFKYTETTPNDFGLTIEEILLAKNKELNQWASLKKAVQIRPESIEKKEQRLYQMKANNEFLKRKIFKSLYGEGSDDETEEKQETPSKREISSNTNPAKKQKLTQPENIASNDKNEEISEAGTQSTQPSVITAGTPDASGPKKKKKKKKKGKLGIVQNGESSTVVSSSQPEGKKIEKSNSQIAPDNNQSNPFTKNKNTIPKGHANNNKDRGNNTTSVSSQSPGNNEAEKSVSKNGQKSNNPFARNKNQLGETRANGFGNRGNNKMGKQNKFNKNKSNSMANDSTNNSQISDDRLKAYGINPRKFHKKQKYGNKTS